METHTNIHVARSQCHRRVVSEKNNRSKNKNLIRERRLRNKVHADDGRAEEADPTINHFKVINSEMK